MLVCKEDTVENNISEGEGKEAQMWLEGHCQFLLLLTHVVPLRGGGDHSWHHMC